ncbi:UDP-glucose 4-epimerase GalE [Halomonas saccharevitans]|uniref:UDP-glucose 4-epimerase n=1 Tax=Halomonas saccharevitans TaxID=416872 RepID=A0ABU3NAU5_9GAMM|nr:UDP-glucose 4-epimerase GalE [Halomonas saccharevitans]MDT8878305.1 UDP-glucose 4-epimerase GalE [Halomonas saccharevitans]
MKILVTGGAGYIGSHAVVALLEAGYQVVVLDNLVNGSVEAVNRAAELGGGEATFIQGDVSDRALLNKLFAEHACDAVMHFAGLKSVGESVEQPLRYFENNVAGTITLCQAMEAAGVFRLVFSSSATVYGEEHPLPWHEGLPTGTPSNPYGRSKLLVEQLLYDLPVSSPRWQISILRYFNPTGAHESGRIGESPQGTPNNLVPYIAQVATGLRKSLAVYGNDYPTVDGTGVRDYLHVMDLVEGHLAAMVALDKRPGVNVWNLGTGQGYSVLEILRAFERASGQEVPYHFAPRRQGDVASCWADPVKARDELGWKAQRDLDAMMTDVWHWQQANPEGYA